MSLLEKVGLLALHRLDPETAHGLAIKALQSGLMPLPGPVTSDRLRCDVAGLSLPNPVGLAAGFDKNASVVSALSRAGFGFVEVGAVTPRPQAGNPKPRLFRLTQDRAAINRFGFNNAGMDVVAANLRGLTPAVPVGINLGANKDSPDRIADYCAVLETLGPLVQFATVNVSSPNTEKLRDLQGKTALTALLEGVLETRASLDNPIPVFVKIAPDLDDRELADIAEVAGQLALDGIIATNTTLSRDGLQSGHRAQAGGLSGAPLFEPSTRVLAKLAHITQGSIPLIGVGGIASAQQALDKIKAGASAVQLYTALVFHGLSLAAKIAQDLDGLLAQQGFDTVRQAVGAETEKWL